MGKSKYDWTPVVLISGGPIIKVVLI